MKEKVRKKMKKKSNAKKGTKKEISWHYDTKSKNAQKEPRLAAGFSYVSLEEENFAVLQAHW